MKEYPIFKINLSDNKIQPTFKTAFDNYSFNLINLSDLDKSIIESILLSWICNIISSNTYEDRTYPEEYYVEFRYPRFRFSACCIIA